MRTVVETGHEPLRRRRTVGGVVALVLCVAAWQLGSTVGLALERALSSPDPSTGIAYRMDGGSVDELGGGRPFVVGFRVENHSPGPVTIERIAVVSEYAEVATSLSAATEVGGDADVPAGSQAILGSYGPLEVAPGTAWEITVGVEALLDGDEASITGYTVQGTQGDVRFEDLVRGAPTTLCRDACP